MKPAKRRKAVDIDAPVPVAATVPGRSDPDVSWFSVRVPPELRRTLDAMSAAEKRSLNSMVWVLLEEAIKARSGT